jgi:glutathione S-transferase
MAARAEKKVTPPFNQFPYLDIDGTSLGQSGACMRYAAGLAGLMPADRLTAALAESVVDQVADVAMACYTPLFASGLSEEERAAQIEGVKTGKMPGLLAGIAAYAEASATPFLFGDISVADIALFAYSEGMGARGLAFEDAAPALKKVMEGVRSHPKLAAYFAKRAEVEAAEAAAAKA